jgi:hypothetical protein
MRNIIAMKISWFTVLTYSMYFSYAIFLIDYKKIVPMCKFIRIIIIIGLSPLINSFNYQRTYR